MSPLLALAADIVGARQMPTPAISFEIEVSLSGTVVPFREATGPSYAHGGDPAEGGYAEDVDIEDIGIISSSFREQVTGGHKVVWETKSILDGVDRNAPEIQKLFANILALKEQEASEAVYDADFE